MTGFGSPCGACKFLRRKCVKGCVFAPYFCHEQGATHFAAIHKVFGASNASKLLMHIPVSDRPEAAVTISYEAQARLQDPIYGCVAHIFALQQQVANLQAQLVSLKTQVAQGLASNTMSNAYQDGPCSAEYSQFFHPQDSNSIYGLEALRVAQLLSNPNQNSAAFCSGTTLTESNNSMGDFSPSMNDEIQYSYDDPSQGTMDSLPMQVDAKKFLYQEMGNWGELESFPVSFLQNS
ncbi:LOB domain-containing protein 29-like [Nymphaea colorata]|nr:LOB domain-containing protein 29-like [Nymphaea colorata]